MHASGHVISAEDLKTLFDQDPRCEVMPSSDSDDPCGASCSASVLLVMDHLLFCLFRRWKRDKFRMWVCMDDMDAALSGRLCCSFCGRPGVAVVVD